MSLTVPILCLLAYPEIELHFGVEFDKSPVGFPFAELSFEVDL